MKTYLKCAISVSGGLGDMISFIPIFTKFPGFLVLSDLYKELFSLYDLDVIWWEEKKSEVENFLKISFEIRKRKPNFVYGTYPNGRRINVLLTLSSGIKIFCDDQNYSFKRLTSIAKIFPKAYPIYIPFGKKESYVSINSKILGVVPDYPFDLKEKEEYKEEAELFSKEKYIAIHPTSRYESRQWDLEKFIGISKRILKKGFKVLFILGKGEEQTLKAIINQLMSEIAVKKIHILYGEPLTKVISYVKRAHMFVGNDSAIAHIAGVSGIKTFVIYGYTRYYHTAPYGAEVIRLDLPCSPCYNFAKGELAVPKECKYNIACLRNITEDMVWDKISNFI